MLKFDEIEVINGLRDLYAALYLDAKKKYRALFEDRYMEMFFWLTGKKPSEDMLDELVDMWLAGFLGEPNEESHYVFDAEVTRKRDRAIEDSESEPTRVQKQLAMEKHLRHWLQMAAWYTDMASQEAEYQALKDFGAAKVKWNIYGDDKVCHTCFEMDGKIFRIDKVPVRPHLRCRCYLTPA